MTAFTEEEIALLRSLADSARQAGITESAAGTADILRERLPDLDDVTMARVVLRTASIAMIAADSCAARGSDPGERIPVVLAQIAANLGGLELDLEGDG
jgi:hypothetical protein